MVVNPISKAVGYIREVRHELMQVVWPKKNDVVRLTLIVLIFSGGMGVYLGVLDFGFTKLLEYMVAR